MRVLALDTATAATVAAVVDTDSGLAVEARDDPTPGARPGHASALLRLVEDVLTRSGGWAEVDRLAVGVGPGTFTGLRIGIATAQGLARSQGTPLVGVSTLQSLALGAAQRATPGHTVMAVIDARRGEAFAAAYTAVPARESIMDAAPAAHRGAIADVPQLGPSVLTPEALAAAVRAHGRDRSAEILAIGDGAIQFRHILEAAGATVPEDLSDLHRVSALWHCRLAETAEPQPLSAIQPQYLRVPDAELSQ